MKIISIFCWYSVPSISKPGSRSLGGGVNVMSPLSFSSSMAGWSLTWPYSGMARLGSKSPTLISWAFYLIWGSHTKHECCKLGQHKISWTVKPFIISRYLQGRPIQLHANMYDTPGFSSKRYYSEVVTAHGTLLFALPGDFPSRPPDFSQKIRI